MKKHMRGIKGDMFLQFKYGIYLIYAIITGVYVIILKQLPRELLNEAVPFIVLTDPSLLGFYFIGGLVLFEKGEGTLEYLIVSPLSTGQYLLFKMISLTILSVVTGSVIVTFSYGMDFNKPIFLTGIILTSLLFVLIGFIAVVRFDTVNKYMLSSIIYMTVLFLPLIDYFGFYKSWIFYLFPTKAAMILIFGAFKSTPLWKIGYGIIYLVGAIGIAFGMAKRKFYKFIILKG